MKKSLSIKKIFSVMIIFVICMQCFIGCGKNRTEAGLLMHLSLNETSGNLAADNVDKNRKGNIPYALSKGTYQEPLDDVQWRKNGISGGALQFDGYSNFINFNYDDIAVKGNAVTIDLWVAPRAYEWSDPNAVNNGTDRLTAFVSQHSKNDKEGILFGMERHGAWSFQVGLGDAWVSVWDDDMPIDKYVWTNITAVFDGIAGELTIYKNGKVAGNKKTYPDSSIQPAIEMPLYIGRNSQSNTIGPFNKNMFSGMMDEVKIYEKILSEEEIESKYQSQLIDGKIKEVIFDDIWFDSDLLKNDIQKPSYHTSAPQHWMNEPHAPFYYNGKYHLFYQFNPFGPYWQQIHWGHWVSDDMVNWVNVKEAISPTANSVVPDGVWSGGVAIKNDGTPALLFTAGDDSRTGGLISNQNIGLATPKNTADLNLTDWNIADTLAVKQVSGQGRAGEFRDPHIWKEDNTWYMVLTSGSTSGSGGTALLYTATNDSFTDWTYRGPVMDWNTNNATYGTSWELPIILPLKRTDGTNSGKYIFSISPAPASTADNSVFYWIGTFNKTTYKFTPDGGIGTLPKKMDFGNNVFTGPSAFIDPVSGKAVMFSIIQDLRDGLQQYNAGWAHNAGLARELWLDSNDNLIIKPLSNLSNNESDVLINLTDSTVSAANDLITQNSVKGDTLKITLKADNITASRIGLNIRQNSAKTEKTQVYFSSGDGGKIGINTGLSGGDVSAARGVFEGAYTLENGLLELELYLDRSIIEAFFGKNTITSRVYSSAGSQSIELFCEGGDVRIKEFKIINMKSIY